MKKTTLLFTGVLCAGTFAAGSITQTAAFADSSSSLQPTQLGVVWTSGDRDVALKMVFMYTLNAKNRGWFDEVRLVVWGPSAKLLSVDEELQQEVARMADAGVELVACKACADSYGVSEKLGQLGVEVKYMGMPLSDMLKGDWEVVTF
ncbi:MAG: DsrE family protein [Gemmatimonadota bacterium]|nr:MAG: DsrE family protein [Gemmatimonadota bacterium]